MLPGIDVSAHRGTVNWPLVKAAGVKFVYSRATNGRTPDPTHDPNQRGCAAVGIPFGSFHYYRPDILDIDQVEAFAFIAGITSLPPALDLEAAGIRLDRVEYWLKRYVEFSGRHDTLIYTRATIWDPLSRANPAAAKRIAAKHKLWVADYTGRSLAAGRPTYFPRDWPPDSWVIWQHSETGAVPGVNNGAPPVDLNWFAGTEEELHLMADDINIYQIMTHAGTEEDKQVRAMLAAGLPMDKVTLTALRKFALDLPDTPPPSPYPYPSKVAVSDANLRNAAGKVTRLLKLGAAITVTGPKFDILDTGNGAWDDRLPLDTGENIWAERAQPNTPPF